MAVKKSIAIIGEGETEWWYFDTLRIACRYKFKLSRGDRCLGVTAAVTQVPVPVTTL